MGGQNHISCAPLSWLRASGSDHWLINTGVRSGRDYFHLNWRLWEMTGNKFDFPVFALVAIVG